jgi:hypothetical protein
MGRFVMGRFVCKSITVQGAILAASKTTKYEYRGRIVGEDSHVDAVGEVTQPL